jgi:diguanylate cyclase (GGDEF)-like protein
VASVVQATAGFGSSAADHLFVISLSPFLYAIPAAICVARGLAIKRERPAWLVLGVAMLCTGAGTLYNNLVLAKLKAPPTPSVSDGLWIGFYVGALCALILLLRSRLTHTRRTLWLDGVISALALAALGAALVVGPLVHASAGHTAALLTSLAYPIGDLVVLSVVVAVFALSGWRPGFDWAIIGAAFAAQVVIDAIYLRQVADGSYVPGTLLDAGWLGVACLLAYAAWRPARVTRTAEHDSWPVLVVPSIMAISSLGVLVYSNFGGMVHPVAAVLATLAIAAVLVRAALTFQEKRVFKTAASEDPLTGLLNHGGFHDALDRQLERSRVSREQFAVLLLDLDRFKVVNDLRGHAEGDRVLRRVADAIREASREPDIAGRVGGDEFGLVLSGTDGTVARSVGERIERAIDALDEDIGVSFGIGQWPGDGPTKEMVLLRADVAVYAAKPVVQQAASVGPVAYSPTRGSG